MLLAKDFRNGQSITIGGGFLPVLPTFSLFSTVEIGDRLGKRPGLVTPTQLSPALISHCNYETSYQRKPDLPSNLPPENSAWGR